MRYTVIRLSRDGVPGTKIGEVDKITDAVALAERYEHFRIIDNESGRIL